MPTPKSVPKKNVQATEDETVISKARRSQKNSNKKKEKQAAYGDRIGDVGDSDGGSSSDDGNGGEGDTDVKCGNAGTGCHVGNAAPAAAGFGDGDVASPDVITAVVAG